MKKADVVVIGSGVAGLSAAFGLKESGHSVIIVEEDLWGGTCPNRGCDPKKFCLQQLKRKRASNTCKEKDFQKHRQLIGRS